MHGKWSRWGLRRHEVRHLAKSNRRSFVPFGFAQGPQDDSRKGRTRARASSGSLRCALRGPVGMTTKEQDESKDNGWVR